MICDYCKEEIKEGTTVFSTPDEIGGVVRSAQFPNVTNLGLTCAASLGALPPDLAEAVRAGKVK